MWLKEIGNEDMEQFQGHNRDPINMAHPGWLDLTFNHHKMKCSLNVSMTIWTHCVNMQTKCNKRLTGLIYKCSLFFSHIQCTYITAANAHTWSYQSPELWQNRSYSRLCVWNINIINVCMPLLLLLLLLWKHSGECSMELFYCYF